MSHKKLGMMIVMIVIPFFLSAQTETFDIITYQPIPGWTKQVTDYAVALSKVDNAAGTWCQVGIYKSVASSGDPANDFSSEWKALVKPDTYAGSVEPKPQTTQADGWTQNYGVSNSKWQGKDINVALFNISGYGTMVSIMVSGNLTKYAADVENLFKSLQFRKPEVQMPVNNSQPVSSSSPEPSPSSIKISNAPGNSGIKLSTTNFDDGWIAQPFADYVLVTKGSINVLLHYSISIDDAMRRVDNMAVAVWDMIMPMRYRVSNVKVFQNEPYTYNKVYFVEADAIELSNNKPCHVALRVLVANGVATPIEIITPTAADFQKNFPDQDKVAAMLNYNKFAVSPTDIVGTWESSSSVGVGLYNAVTGAYTGSNTTAMADSFEFRNDGNYHSNHKGASTMYGATTTYDQKYDGKYTLTNWDVTVTNRFKGKTDVYWCEFQAVRGGRILKLVQKDATAMRYELVKTK